MKDLEKILKAEVKKAEIDYNPYFLSRNPFPINPIASPGSPFCEDVRTDERDKLVKRCIIPAFKKHKGVHFWINGLWGVGKSAFMHYVSNHINKVFKKKNLAVAVYVDSIGSGMTDITRKVVGTLGADFFGTMRNLLLERLTLKNMDDLVVIKGLDAFMPGVNSDAKKKMIQSQIEKDPSSVMRLLRSGVIDNDKLQKFVKKELIERKCSVTFVDLFIKLLEDVEGSYYELYKKLKTKDDLCSIFKAIELAGFRMIYLFIDQFENQIQSFTDNAVDRFVIALCDLTDRCRTCLTVVLTITPIFSTSIVKSASFERLLDHPRMPLTRQIVLTKLNLPKTVKLVRFYLNSVRKKQAPATISDLHPFNQGAIKIIHERGKGLPGNILLHCRDLLERGAEKGYVIINEGFVRGSK